MRHRLLIAAILLAGVASAPLFAQTQQLDEFVSGTEYYLAFPSTVSTKHPVGWSDERFNEQFTIEVYSAVANQVTITRGASGPTITRSVAPGSFTEIELKSSGITNDIPTPMVTAVGAVSDRSYHLAAQHPVIVYCHEFTLNGGESWTPLPTRSWGRHYIASCLPATYVYDLAISGSELNKTARPAPAFVLVVAGYDSTVVTIDPDQLLSGSYPTTVTLNRGDVYQIWSGADTTADAEQGGVDQPDIAGSSIGATRPVMVLSGNTRAPLPDGTAGLVRNAFKNLEVTALAPTDQFGDTIAFAPMIDQLFIDGDRTSAFLRLYGLSSQKVPGVMRRADSTTDTFSVQRLQPREIAVRNPLSAAVFTAAGPMMAAAYADPITKYVGAPNDQKNIPYDGWSGFMIEMIPREQWSTFAPVRAPSSISGMKSYVVVVTDSTSNYDGLIRFEDGSRFPFNGGAIKGTDLVWGTAQLSAGQTRTITGLGDSKFFGYTFGVLKGQEIMQRSLQNVSYDDKMSIAYGYPLAPRRRYLGPPDTMDVTSSMDCSTLSVDARVTNANPAGLRSISLENAVNAHIAEASPVAYPGVVSASASVVPDNPLLDASATVVVLDRTGGRTEIPYSWTAEGIAVPGSIDFGAILKDERMIRVVHATNPTSRPVVISSIVTAGDTIFTVDSVSRTLPFTLAPGGSIDVVVSATPTVGPRSFSGSLRFGLACSVPDVQLSARSIVSCIEVSDIDFGVVPVGQTATRDLTICNRGEGTLHFAKIDGDKVVTWNDKAFSINSLFQTNLLSTDLATNECRSISVYFVAQSADSVRTVAYVGSNSQGCRDSSVWTALGSGTTHVESRRAASSDLSIDEIRPIPGGDRLRIGFTVPDAGPTRIEVYDVAGRLLGVALDRNVPAGAGVADWDRAGFPKGALLIRLVHGGGAKTALVVW